MPLVSMNAVVSHCAVLLVMLNSAMRCGSAEVISVWLRIAVKLPTIITRMGMSSRFDEGGCAAVRPDWSLGMVISIRHLVAC